jgi:peptidoglycan/xylan/chitin deacetylase (PgdA/CDA1 family)
MTAADVSILKAHHDGTAMVREDTYALETGPARGRWRPPSLLRLSALAHAACIATLSAQPAWWPWLLSVLAANHLLLGAAVFFPRARLLGPNLTRLAAPAIRRREVCLTFDDGPDPAVTPRVLELLDRYHAKASFFCIGEKAAAHPDIVREIARRGHSIENHSYRHSHAFAFYGLGRLRREVALAQRAIIAICGQAPVFFRAPAGFRGVLLDAVLADIGLRYVSWTRRGYDAVSSDPASILRRLTRGLAAGDVLLLHDGASARTRDGEPVVLAVLPALLDQVVARGLIPVSLRMAWSAGRAA